MHLAGSALLATTPGASAADDSLLVPAPPHLISTVVTGCHAPCAIGTGVIAQDSSLISAVQSVMQSAAAPGLACLVTLVLRM